MRLVRMLPAMLFATCLILFSAQVIALAQPQTAPQPAQTTDEKTSKPAVPEGEAKPEHESMGRQLAKEEREAEGEEENSNLKHSAMVQKLAKLTGLTTHQAHLLAVILNFAIIAIIIFWFGRKSVPGMLRARNESIQRALEEARSASQDAGRRLADIENRLRQMDVEIGKMRATADQEAQAEERRIQKTAEEEIQKVVQAAEQEIAAAAKQARRELSTHTADLAVALARKQINVDANTDQVLVRNFASKLAPGSGGKDGR